MSVIKPSDIDTSRHFFDAFGNYETEVSANYIVRFCQERGNWEPFSYEELNEFCKRVGHKRGFWFNRLGKDGFIEKGADGAYRVTHRFICRCYESSPLLTRASIGAEHTRMEGAWKNARTVSTGRAAATSRVTVKSGAHTNLKRRNNR